MLNAISGFESVAGNRITQGDLWYRPQPPSGILQTVFIG